MKRLAILIAVLALAAFGLATCGNDDDETTATAGRTQPVGAGVFVGRVDGTDAEIALITNGQHLSGAYLCSPNGAVWFRPATFAGGAAELVPRSGETLGEASFAGEGASGTVDVGGGSHDFSAELATGKAGLYRTASGKPESEGGVSETGWIVLPNGSKCGRTNSITPGGDFKSEPAASRPKGHVTDFTNPFAF
jgi:predicted small secreted protein